MGGPGRPRGLGGAWLVLSGLVLLGGGRAVGGRAGPGGTRDGLLLTCSDLRQVVAQRGHVERPLPAQRPGERPPLLREHDALQVAVHGGAAARQTAGRIGDDSVPDRDDTQQGGPVRPRPAAHAGAHRARSVGRLGVYRALSALARGRRALPCALPPPRRVRGAAYGALPGGAASALAPDGSGSPGPAVSLRMSMRQPVSRAASRAFCPSRPIASDSW